ncbi:MAG: secretin N-terminal domain-containing protein, partial [Candidatus Binataceae bacterium]
SKGLRPASFFGHDDKAAASAQPAEGAEGGAQKSADGEGYELNFENASVTTIAKVVLGDILGVGYTIDPRVQGTVTISSGRPVPKDDLVYVLENALRIANTVLVKDKDGYRLLTAGDAQGNGAVRRAGDNVGGGYGVTAVPLRYASAQTIFKLLDSFAIKPGMARVEPAHNLIVVQGTGAERRNAVETIMSFDVDWMRGQSVGIYPVQNTTPEEMIKELDKIMAVGENGLNRNLVTLQPINRLNAVLVVSRRDNLLRAASTWISRLDKSNSEGAAVRVYRLRYGNAKQVASILNDIFGTKQSSGLNAAVNQIAPGAGVAGSASGSRLGGGLTGSSSSGGLGGSGGLG